MFDTHTVDEDSVELVKRPSGNCDFSDILQAKHNKRSFFNIKTGIKTIFLKVVRLIDP